MTLFFAGLCLGLVAAAAAAFAASRAHQRHAVTLREMSDTWGALSRAQRMLKRGDAARADQEIERAAQTIIASRRRRGATS